MLLKNGLGGSSQDGSMRVKLDLWQVVLFRGNLVVASADQIVGVVSSVRLFSVRHDVSVFGGIRSLETGRYTCRDSSWWTTNQWSVLWMLWDDMMISRIYREKKTRRRATAQLCVSIDQLSDSRSRCLA